MALEASPTLIVVGGTVGVLPLRALYRWWNGSNGTGYPYPPGPKGYPFINNIFDLPIDRPWEGYVELSKQYGDLLFFRAFNTPIMVVCSQRRSLDLFEKRSTVYSGRPHSVMMHELLKFDNFFAILDYGLLWRKHRRTFHENFHAGIVRNYHHILDRYTHRLLVAISKKENLEEAARNTIAGLGIQILYGVDVKSVEDPFIADALEVAEAFKQAGVPGRFLVEGIPLMKYIPSWFPGAAFQRWADFYRKASRRVLDNPFEFVWNKHKAAEAVPCIATKLIDKFSDDEVQRQEDSMIARNVCSQTHLAAVDTTHSSCMGFFLAMTIHPEIQKKCQEELDRVAGPHTIPGVDQINEFPYIHAVVKETLRWHQVLPLGLPHFVSEDHIYDGYFIPKGTVVFGNAWGMMHDPELFEDPMTFNPERYLKDGKLDPEAIDFMGTFGFGRRICPGRHLAIDILFSIVTSTLALYDILPPKDEHGKPVKIEPRFTGGALMKPEDFECVFEPRSAAARDVIQDLLQTVT